MKTTLTLLGILFLLSSPALHSQKTETDTLEPYIRKLMRDLEVPGMSVAIVRDGEIFYS